jgi:FkbM family methyltransferase
VWQYWDIFVEEFYYFTCDKVNPVIYDLGSNIGLSIIYFKEKFPGARVYAFEPQKKIFDSLQFNLKSFGIGDKLDLHSSAIWIHNEGLKLNIIESDAATVLESRNADDSYFVPSIRLNDLLDQESEIDFLKMDIEGAEVTVLQDCEKNLGKVKNLFVEYHSYPGRAQELDNLLKMLKNQGFRVQINSPFRYRRPFIRKYLHDSPDMDLQINIFAFHDGENRH